VLPGVLDGRRDDHGSPAPDAGTRSGASEPEALRRERPAEDPDRLRADAMDGQQFFPRRRAPRLGRRRCRRQAVHSRRRVLLRTGSRVTPHTVTVLGGWGSAGVLGDLAVESVAEAVGFEVEVVLGLEVEPEPRGRAEVAGEA
jgi:hypothetical protein